MTTHRADRAEHTVQSVPWESRYAAFAVQGRAALLDGGQTYERPLGETGRWGVSVVFRPPDELLAKLTELACELYSVLGPGHWIHGPHCRHATLRPLEFYRPVVPPGDERIQAYADALDEATRALPPVEVAVRGLSPHAGGVLLFVCPLDAGLTELEARFNQALHDRDACTNEQWHVRDLWNIGLVHFASPLANPREFVDWCDCHRQIDLGTVTFDAADLVRAHPAPSDVRLETLHRSALSGGVRDHV